jgi:hypothetical protein
MNRRGRRLAFTVAATGLAVVIGLCILHWNTVRDHVEAWRFQLTSKTETIEPNPALKGLVASLQVDDLNLRGCVQVLANHSGFRVIVDRAEYTATDGEWAVEIHAKFSQAGSLMFDDGRGRTPPGRETVLTFGVTTNWALQALKVEGYRVLEQRFPRRAYVVIRDEHFDEAMKALTELGRYPLLRDREVQPPGEVNLEPTRQPLRRK